MVASSRYDGSRGSTWRATETDTSARERTRHVPSQVGRFQIDALLGEGGMGRVFRAFDPHLRRQVALKMLQPDQHGGVERFVREARSQAAVHHPAVCSVYEVGVDGDAPFIVMQLIEGRPLDEAVADMPLEQKLVVFQQVGEAVHAAHRTGLIHRDIKPSNILVEAPADGPVRPYVLDFGLARTLDNRVTREGVLLGTPAYMAPEQILGKVDRLDRRTDVFALGATLYHVLAGQPPFPGSESAVVRAILEEEPAPLGPLGIPPEVAAITFKCLEKDPGRRYASARALAEDIGRFLNGEPVIARPLGSWYRLQKWASRNRLLVTVSSALLILLVTALAWGIWTAWKSEERERRARFFTEKVEEAEALVRYSHMAPAHDVRADRVLLRDLITTLEAEMEGLGDLGRGAGSYALGRVHLALEELDAAHRYLNTAWRSGYRTPEVAATLAETLSALYREHLTALELTSDWENRRQRLEQLDRTYGDPARLFLKESRVEERPLGSQLAAIVHFHGDRFEPALAVLTSAKERRPWSYESYRLEGDIRRAWAIRKFVDGESVAARTELADARAAYQQGIRIATSNPGLRRADAQAVYVHLSFDVFEGQDPGPYLADGFASIEGALELDREDAEAWLWKARLYRLKAQWLYLKSADAMGELDVARLAAQRAVELRDEPSEAWRELGRIHGQQAEQLLRRGEDPSDAIDRATAALDRVAPERRDYAYWLALGTARLMLGDSEAGRGKPAAIHYSRAADAYRAALADHSSPYAAWNNLGIALFKASGLPETQAPRTLLGSAVEAFEKALGSRPDFFVPHYYLGRSFLRLAQGGDPASGLLDANVEKAIASYERALELSPGMFALHSSLGEAFHLQGVAAWERGEDPEPFFQKAREAYGAGLEIAPESPVLLLNLAWTAYFQGKFRVREGRKTDGYLDEAIQLAERAREKRKSVGSLLCLGSAHRLRMEAALQAGGDPSPDLDAAVEALRGVTLINPRHAEGWRSLGRLWTTEAKAILEAGRDAQAALTRAREALDLALRLEPAIAYFQLADARWYRIDARWRSSRGLPAAESVESGLRSTRRAVELRPDWVEPRTLEKVLSALTF